MITISTIEPALLNYTAPVEITASEPPKSWEPEENGESSSFARILAETLAEQENPKKSEAVDDAALEIDVLNGEDLNFFANPVEIVELPVEKPDFLLSADHLVGRLGEQTEKLFDDGSAGRNIANIENIDVENDSTVSQLLQGDKKSQQDVNAEKSVFSRETSVLSGKTDSLAELSAVTQTATKELAAADKNQKKDAKDRLVTGQEAAKTESAQLKQETQSKQAVQTPVINSRSTEEAAAARAGGQEKTRLEESRGRSRRDRMNVEVRDFRTGDSGSAANNAAKTSEMRLFAGAETRVQGADSPREITLELRLPDYQNTDVAQTRWEVKSASALENMLARELHQNFNGDIVRHASMALRDGGEGTIRLALKPESLGNVKIQLEMAENKITGQIFVESEEALRAFKKEIQSLEQAFRDSGFADANLNLSLTTDGQSMEWQKQQTASIPPNVASSRYDDSFELTGAEMIDVYFNHESLSVNVLI